MSAHAATLNPPSSRRLGRSIGAVGLGFLAVFVLSLGTDQVLHVLNVYPPWGEPMNDPGLNALALAYRCVYGVIGSYLMARFAPYAPMRHAWIGAAIGFVFELIRANEPAAAIALGLSLLGFVLPLVSAIAHSANVWDCLIWALIALIVQIIVYFLVRVPVPKLSERIASGELAAAIWLGLSSLAAGALNAACMIY